MGICIVTNDFLFHIVNGDIKMPSTQIADFFVLPHISVCELIRNLIDKGNGSSFDPCTMGDPERGEQYVYCYYASKYGCLLLAEIIEGREDEKKAFSNLIRSIKQVN